VPTNALLSAPTTEPATRYLPGLDGLRGIAVLGVLGYHFGAPMLSGGYLGVDMFFVISGFVVTRNLARMAGDRRWFRTFYGRRVARLMPAMLVLLLAVSVSWMVSGDVGAGRGTALAGALTMSANLAEGTGRGGDSAARSDPVCGGPSGPATHGSRGLAR
jgi:peptidoglycan/LPS O-acetylase OafA/YrhL